MSFRFERNSRLLSKQDFSKVFEESNFRVSGRHLLILAKFSSQYHSARLGMVVSKKNIRQAVERNRVKRLIREFFRLNRAKMPGLDLVFLTRRGISELDNRQIRELLEQSLLRVRKKLQVNSHTKKTCQQAVSTQGPEYIKATTL